MARSAGLTAVERVGHLEARYDAQTVRQLRRIGPAPGWRCLQVGVGGGFVARWLAEQVGATESVVSIDGRSLDGVPPDPRAGDVTEAFDLVHCRSILGHLDPAATFCRLADAVAPGGWFLLEEEDFGPFWSSASPVVIDAIGRLQARMATLVLRDL